MSKNSSSIYRSAISGRYITGKSGASSVKASGVGMTKERLARVERSWRRASEETGAFKTPSSAHVTKREKV